MKTASKNVMGGGGLRTANKGSRFKRAASEDVEVFAGGAPNKPPAKMEPFSLADW